MKGSEKSRRLSRLLACVIAAGTLVLTAVLLFTGEVRVELKPDRMEIRGSYWADATVLYADVKSVRLVTDFSAGSRTNGFGGGRLSEGHFRSDLFGDYILYAYSACHTCVALETANGVVAVNAATENETRALYSSIAAAVSAFQGDPAG